ncbi:FAD-binding oxidoreductase [Microbacterium terregens]|uniref:FAD-binding oxidoreductase n=1 Tax=Microbacterium terregens TaxID=69363 RepID=A0ABV5T271_9MICO
MTIELPSILPDGVEREDYARAVAALVDALGADAVQLEGIEEFRDPYDWPEWDTHWPSAIVQPGSVEDVQTIVRIANDHGVPLWTHSQGKNNGYGGGAPRVRGSITLNFRRMNRILEINEELGYVVVEPGVTFYELVDELAARGGDWWPSTPDLGWGSVVGNTVDHGVGYTEFGDHAAAASGLEIVLADGSLLRTGMWASSTSQAGHAHPRGFGPNVESLFMQSNLGIVTKLGRRISPAPELFAPLRFRVWEDADLVPLIDATRTLMLEGTIRNIPVIGGVLGTAAMRGPRSQWLDGPMTESDYRRMMKELGAGWWNLRAAVSGPRAVVEAQLERIREVLEAAVPSGEFSALPTEGHDVSEETLPLHPDRVQAGRPSQSLLKSVEWWGPDGGHLELSPVAPNTGRDAVRIGEILREEMEGAGFDFWPSICLFPRSLVYLGVINFDHSDPQRIQAAYDVYDSAVRRLGAEGYPLYRGHVRGMDVIQDQYDWNEHAYRRFVERLKDALDPQGILSPGKQGIWPASYRTDDQ